MAADPIDLTTIANAKAWCDVASSDTSGDATFQRLVTAASSLIGEYLDRTTLKSASVTETRNGWGGLRMPLKVTPVTAVASVTVDGVSIPAVTSSTSTGFTFDSLSVMLRGYCFTRGYQNVVFTYTGGYTAIPSDIEQACIELVAQKWKRKGHTDEVSHSLGGAVTVSFSQLDFPKEVRAALNPYRRVWGAE